MLRVKNKKMNQKINTKLGTAIIIIFAITAGVFVWKYENTKNTDMNSDANISKTLNANNHYLNSDYGFSLDLPNSTDKYIIQVSPDTIGKISFLLPATNQIYTTRYTGHTWADAFNILVYPKIKIDEIRNDCEQDSSQNKPYYKCTLINSKPVVENDTYFFYYLRGGTAYATYVSPAFESRIYAESENALKTLRTFPALLTFDENTWHVLRDNKYGYEISYPNDWYTSWRIPVIKDDNVYLQTISGPDGSIVFDNNYLKNNSSSLEKNLKFINKWVNIVGAKSTFREVKIEGGRAFYSPVRTSISPLERAFVIVGKNNILNGTFQSSSMNQQAIDKFVEIISQFKFL
jgi:hypothetical protein